MDYFKHYELLITTRKDRQPLPNQYYEDHHIKPKCIGGTDDLSNLISLTPEEHYVAHLLLAKMYDNVPGLWYACKMMTSGLPGRSNKLYGWVRRRCADYHSTSVKEAWSRKYGFDSYEHQCEVIWDLYINQFQTIGDIKKKFGMAKANIGRCLSTYAAKYDLMDLLVEGRSKIRSILSSSIRNSFTPEQEEKRIAARKRTGYSTNQKGEARSGKNNPVYGLTWTKPLEVCPHCMKEVRGKRWHFDNCKERKI